MRERLIVASFLCIALLFLSTPILTFAEELNLVPTISARALYDDNVFFSFRDKVDDFKFTVRPAATLQYYKELLKIDMTGELEVDRYIEETDLDTEKYRLNFDGNYQFVPRWTVLGQFAVTKDDTFDTELTETGRVSTREDRLRYDAGGGLNYQLTERSDIGLNLRYNRKEFKDRGTDTDRIGVIGEYNRTLQNQLDVVSLIPFYNYRDNDAASLHVTGAALGWQRPFSEIMTLNARAGLHYWDQDVKADNKQNTGWGPVADINLERSGEMFFARFGFRRDIRTPTSGRFVNVNRFYFRFSRNLTERWRGTVDGSLYFSNRIKGTDDKRRYGVLNPSLIFRITENHNASLNYSYRNEYVDNLDDTRINHRVWLWINFNFPKYWSW